MSRPTSPTGAKTPEQIPMPDTAAFDLLAHIIATRLLRPACLVSAADPHARWKPVNRAAGVIVGYVLSFDLEHVDRLRLAQHLVEDCLRFLAEDPPQQSEEATKMHAMIAGPNGLVKRVAECLVQAGVEE